MIRIARYQNTPKYRTTRITVATPPQNPTSIIGTVAERFRGGSGRVIEPLSGQVDTTSRLKYDSFAR